jgi:hypothetical protein
MLDVGSEVRRIARNGTMSYDEEFLTYIFSLGQRDKANPSGQDAIKIEENGEVWLKVSGAGGDLAQFVADSIMLRIG